MPSTRLHNETGTYDLFAGATILTDTPSPSGGATALNHVCLARLSIGNGGAPLDANDANFTVEVTIGGQVMQPVQVIQFTGRTRSGLNAGPFMVPYNKEITIDLSCDNANDTAVYVQAELYSAHSIALPNNAANTAGGIPVSYAGALDLDAMNATIGTIASDIAGGDSGGIGEPPLAADATNQSTWIRIFHKATALPAEDVTASATNLAIWYQRQGGTKESISISNLGSVNAAHSDGGLIHIDDGWYRLDVPDAAFVTGTSQVLIGGTADDYVIQGRLIPVQTYTLASIVSLLGIPDGYDSLTEQLAAVNLASSSGTASSAMTGGLSGEVVSDNLVVYTGEAKAWTFTVVDEDSAAVDLSGKTVKLIVEQGRGDDLFTPITGTVSGDNNNIVTVQTASGNHSTPGTYYYTLWNDTDDLVLARGKYYIVATYGED